MAKKLTGDNYPHTKMKKSIIIFSALTILIGCTNDTDFWKGKRQLENQGYTDIKNTGYSAFCCDEKDQFSSGFTGKDKNGNVVSGCICSGIMKGITIRYE